MGPPTEQFEGTNPQVSYDAFEYHLTAFFGVAGTVRQLDANTIDLAEEQIAAIPLRADAALAGRAYCRLRRPGDRGPPRRGMIRRFSLLDTARWRGSACVTGGDQKVTID